MSDPTKVERVALLELFLDLGGPLCWTGPIPYDALAARHAVALQEAQVGRPGDAPTIPAQGHPVDATVAA